jgi:hypothetical protein
LLKQAVTGHGIAAPGDAVVFSDLGGKAAGDGRGRGAYPVPLGSSGISISSNEQHVRCAPLLGLADLAMRRPARSFRLRMPPADFKRGMAEWRAPAAAAGPAARRWRQARRG